MMSQSLISVIILLQLIWISGISGQTVRKLTNIDYIGTGYDLVAGNPHSNLHDPGFKRSVIDLTYNEKALSSDGQWMVPDNVQALQAVSCNQHVDVDEVMTTTVYQQVLTREVKVRGGFLFGRFRRSRTYQEVREDIETYHRVIVESVAKCSIYKAGIKSYYHINVSRAFQTAVKNLPITKNCPEYMKFIDRFGTHYVDEIKMGSKATVQSKFEQTSYNDMKRRGVSVKTGASLAFSMFSVGASYGRSSDVTAKNEFMNKRTSYKATFVGGRPPPDGKWETWAQQSGESPFPIAYSLEPIEGLFKDEYIRDFNSSVLMIKQKNFIEMVDWYSGSLSSECPGSNQVAQSVPLFLKTDVYIKDQSSAVCASGYSLVSCGLANVQFSIYDQTRFAYPASATSCACREYQGARCVAWCARSVRGFQIIQVAFRGNGGQATATCPNGKKVIGCHIGSATTTSFRSGNRYTTQTSKQHYYPVADGRSCICYDSSPVSNTCIASCASNVQSSTIRSQYGRGMITVSCTSGTVLGCGILSNSPEPYRSVYVYTTTSCQCYDSAGATCYAICGVLN